MTRWIFYHADCLDGFGAAYAAWAKFGYGAMYRACRYDEGEDPFDMCEEGDEVYVLDFSFKRDILLRQKKRLKIQVIDHHASAEEDLEGLDFCIFDKSKSGAVLSWEFFHTGQHIPKLLRHIQDRDLWKFEMYETREITTALRSMSYDFEIWKQHLTDTSTLSEIGSIQLGILNEQVRDLTRKAGWLKIKGHIVPAVNSFHNRSEIGHALIEKFPEAPFSVVFFDFQVTGKAQWCRTYSLRSEAGFDVAELAESFGGGGHKTASGFTVSFGVHEHGHSDIESVHQ